MKGLFITFEGPDGGGKSTQVSRLARRLREMHLEVVTTREPGGTPAGEAIRNILQHDTVDEEIFPETEALLFAASRSQLVRSTILPALKRGRVVLSDRFMDSTTAYQSYGRGLDVEIVQRLNRLAIDGAVPDITFLLDINVSAGFERLGRRCKELDTGHDRIERQDAAFHERVRDGYLDLAAKEPARFHRIDAAQDEDDVENEIWRVVGNILREKDIISDDG